MVEAFNCPLCLDVLDSPIIINCGNNHRFCTECIKRHLSQGKAECPVCRQLFDVTQCVLDNAVMHAMNNTTTQCSGCNIMMRVSELRRHTTVCSEILEQEKKTKQEQMVQNPVVTQLPNRHTFQCPFCPADHLDHKGLISHCNQLHMHSSQHVVCPICASMPWGDVNFKSANFINHLNLRHKFEYETYVDFQENDDAMMAAALQASMVEK